MLIELDNTFLKALRSGINLFLGSGFPVLATNKKDRKPFPIGNALKDELISHFEVEHLRPLHLAQLCAVIDSSRREELRSYLNDRFDVGEWDKRYSSVERVNITAIFTTNIDNLIYKIYEIVCLTILTISCSALRPHGDRLHPLAWNGIQ